MEPDGARPEAEAVSLGPGEGTTVSGPVGGPLTWKVRSEQSGGRMTAIENVIPPGQGPPFHRHANEDESWQVLEGELRFRLGDDIASAPAGSFVYVPRGTPHCFQNVGTEAARILVIFTPGGMEEFFDPFAELPEDAKVADAFRELGARVGMEVVGPPLAVSHPL